MSFVNLFWFLVSLSTGHLFAYICNLDCVKYKLDSEKNKFYSKFSYSICSLNPVVDQLNSVEDNFDYRRNINLFSYKLEAFLSCVKFEGNNDLPTLYYPTLESHYMGGRSCFCDITYFKDSHFFSRGEKLFWKDFTNS